MTLFFVCVIIKEYLLDQPMIVEKLERKFIC